MTQKFHIFCDLDGVICNFDKAFVQLDTNTDGISFNEYKNKHGLQSAWKLVSDKGIRWWSHMDWMPDGKILWNHIKQYNPTILSAPSRDRVSILGKVEWVNRELGLNITEPTLSPKPHRWVEGHRLILNSEKHLFNKRYTNSILIDDTPKKVDQWVDKGGIAILHTNAEKTIKELDNIVNNLSDL